MKTAAEIRQSFIDFFVSKEHSFVKSAPVAPQDDPTLLFTNAGMNQFKSIFLGENKEGLKRAANSQKCMRVSGKHNDLEEVGVDHHHHTLFEMLGNWSFGDYYKKEAIAWAWELCTEVWGLDKSTLYATIYTEDDEAEVLWKEVTDIDHDHIGRHGAKDNFWEMGETGPCGPCSEIHVDTGEGTCIYEDDPNHTCGVNADECGRYVEIWNLVFMQYNRMKDGTLEDLPAKHVDTGMGLERIVRIIQGVRSNYDSDLFMPIISKLEEMSGMTYGFGSEGIPFRVIADHMRALVFAITDGVNPSNDGRGYVLRRLLRRAYRYGRKLNFDKPFMYTLVPIVVDMMKHAFPEVGERADFVTSIIKGEEERFDQTLETGIEKFNQMAEAHKAAGKTEISGDDLFVLYGTYGFPVDLTNLLAQEVGMTVDESGFEQAMAAQKEHNRKVRAGGDDGGLSADGWTIVGEGSGTEFVGYDAVTGTGSVTRYKLLANNEALVVLDKTPFYAEMGGQCGDRGTLATAAQEAIVVDTITWNDMMVHKLKFDEEPLSSFFEAELTATIDTDRRDAIIRNHSATHLLQAALEQVLGEHVSQSGSRVDADSLRFDFTHFSGLTAEEITKVEDLVNQWVMAGIDVDTNVMNVDEAKAAGAKALFGEKYGDEVRVVKMGDASAELCGGTHVANTGNIGFVTITSESSVSAGVRRIEAVSGTGAIALYRKKATTTATIAQGMKVAEDKLVEKVGELQAKVKKLEGELKELTAAAAGEQGGALIDAAKANAVGSLLSTVKNLGAMDKDGFAALVDGLSDEIRAQKLENAIVVIGAAVDGKAMLGAVAGKAAAGTVRCGDVVKAIGKFVKGGGGGSPVRAMAGGKEPAGLDDAMNAAEEFIASKA